MTAFFIFVKIITISLTKNYEKIIKIFFVKIPVFFDEKNL